MTAGQVFLSVVLGLFGAAWLASCAVAVVILIIAIKGWFGHE